MAHKAVFLDRDDTIIHDPGYISDPNQVRLLEGAGQSLRELHKLGFKLIVVTNQSGIARGVLTEKQLSEIHHRFKQLLAHEGVVIDDIYYCPYHPDGKIAEFTKESDLRKPNPGMILKAADEHNIDIEQSWMVGNSDRDVAAGLKAGCKTILIQPSLSVAEIKYTKHQADYVATNIKEATNIIKSQVRKKVTPDNIKSAMEIKPQPKPIPDEEPIAVSPPQPSQPAQQEEKPSPKPEPEIQNHTDSSNYYLQEIYKLLKAQQRDKMFSEFSNFMLIAGALQIIVIFLLIAAIWFVIKPSGNSAYICLSFATVIQLMAFTFWNIKQK